MEESQNYKEENISRIYECVNSALVNLKQIKSIIKEKKFDLNESRTTVLESIDKTIEILSAAENRCKNSKK